MPPGPLAPSHGGPPAPDPSEAPLGAPPTSVHQQTPGYPYAYRLEHALRISIVRGALPGTFEDRAARRIPARARAAPRPPLLLLPGRANPLPRPGQTDETVNVTLVSVLISDRLSACWLGCRAILAVPSICPKTGAPIAMRPPHTAHREAVRCRNGRQALTPPAGTRSGTAAGIAPHAQ